MILSCMRSKLDIFAEGLGANLTLDDDKVLGASRGADFSHHYVLLLLLDHKLLLDDGGRGGGSWRENVRGGRRLG